METDRKSIQQNNSIKATAVDVETKLNNKKGLAFAWDKQITVKVHIYTRIVFVWIIFNNLLFDVT